MVSKVLSPVHDHRVYSGAYGCPNCGGDTYADTVIDHPLSGHRMRCMDCGAKTGVVCTDKTSSGDQDAIADYARGFWIFPDGYYLETRDDRKWERICDYAKDSWLHMRSGVIHAHAPVVVPAGNARRIGRVSVTLSSLPGGKSRGNLCWAFIKKEKEGKTW